MSPSQIPGCSESLANEGKSTSGPGRRACSPNRPGMNTDGPSPNVTVRREGSRPSASPVSTRGSTPVLAAPTGFPAVS